MFLKCRYIIVLVHAMLMTPYRDHSKQGCFRLVTYLGQFQIKRSEYLIELTTSFTRKCLCCLSKKST